MMQIAMICGFSPAIRSIGGCCANASRSYVKHVCENRADSSDNWDTLTQNQNTSRCSPGAASANVFGMSIAFIQVAMQRHTLAGHITSIQEERFRLSIDDGHTFLFTLDRKNSDHMPALRRLQESRALVRVEYSGEPNTRSGVVHDVCAMA
jgi:hypothetical protein